MLPLQLNGKSDDSQLLAITAYLRDTHHIPIERIKKDWFILFSRDDYSTIGITEYVTNNQLESHPIVRHPDIILLDKSHKIKCIIELDGSIHKTKPGARKTIKRNTDYHYANISCIVIDIIDLKFLKISWFDYLDEQLKKLTII